MYVKWLRRSPFYVVKFVLLLQLISRTTEAGCSVDHGSGMNYPTTTASGTWTTRGGISSYGWDSRQPIDPCSRCTNAPPPLPGSQYTTQAHDNNYNVNDRISVSGYVSDNRVSGYVSDNRGSGYGLDNRITGLGSDSRPGNGYNSDSRVNVYYNTNSRPNDYNLNSYNAVGGNGGYISGTNYGGNSHITDNHVYTYNGYNANRNPDYRGNGYDNLSPEWERRHNNKKGTGGGGDGGGGYYQGTSYSVSNFVNGQGAQMQGSNYLQRPSNDRWGIKGAYPVKIESSGYWQSQPPKDIGWDEDSKKVGVVAGWIGGQKKYESVKPSQGYGTHQSSDKDDDDYFNKGTGYDNSDRKKPIAGGWGGSGSYEVVKMSNGYKYIDRNSNGGDYGSTYGNSYGYGGQSYSYNRKPSQDYGSKPLNVDHGRPHYGNDQPTNVYDKTPAHQYDKTPSPHDYGSNGPVHDYGSNRPVHEYGSNRPVHEYGSNRPVHEYGSNRPVNEYSSNPSSHDYGSNRPMQEWSTPRPIGFEITTTSRPPMAWGSQKPGYPVIASRPTQHWGENSFSEQPSGGGSGSAAGYDRPMRLHGYGSSRPDDYGSSRPNGYGSSRPDGYGSSRPDGYGSSRPDGYASLRPDGYGSSRPGISGEVGGGGRPDYGAVRPIAGSMHHNSIMVSDYGAQRPEFGGYSGSGVGGSRPQTNQRPSYDNERPFIMNGNDIYGSQQQQTGSGYGKGYASNWEYSNSMRGQSSSAAGGWNDQPRDYLQRRPDGDVLQSGSSLGPSESTPVHYNGHSGIGASTDNGFLYKSPATASSSTTPMPTTDS